MFGIWCAPIFSILIAIGWLDFAHFWAPAAADLSAEATKEFFTVTYRDGMILGNSILIVGCALLVVASIQYGLMLAEIEGPRPLYSMTCAISGILIAVIVFLNSGFWIGAAYRQEAGVDVVVALNDTAWFGFLLGWVFLALQMWTFRVSRPARLLHADGDLERMAKSACLVSAQGAPRADGLGECRCRSIGPGFAILIVKHAWNRFDSAASFATRICIPHKQIAGFTALRIAEA